MGGRNPPIRHMDKRETFTQEEWTHVHVRIPRKYYENPTDKAQAFNLWGKKRMWFASSLIKEWNDDGEDITFTVPKWYIAKHGLRSIVEDFDKHHFPTQKELRERIAPKLDFTEPTPEPPKPQESTRYVYDPDDLEW